MRGPTIPQYLTNCYIKGSPASKKRCEVSSSLPGVILKTDRSQLACPRIWTSFCWSHSFELGRPAPYLDTNILSCRHVIIYISHKLSSAWSRVVRQCKRDIFDGVENFEKGCSMGQCTGVLTWLGDKILDTQMAQNTILSSEEGNSM